MWSTCPRCSMRPSIRRHSQQLRQGDRHWRERVDADRRDRNRHLRRGRQRRNVHRTRRRIGNIVSVYLDGASTRQRRPPKSRSTNRHKKGRFGAPFSLAPETGGYAAHSPGQDLYPGSLSRGEGPPSIICRSLARSSSVLRNRDEPGAAVRVADRRGVLHAAQGPVSKFVGRGNCRHVGHVGPPSDESVIHRPRRVHYR